ncbi:MAG: hypothetical protein ACKOEZ_14120 [Spartobacteria bacterium]
MKSTLTLLAALLLAPFASLFAADIAAPPVRNELTTKKDIQVAAYCFPNWGPMPHSEWNSRVAPMKNDTGGIKSLRQDS